MRRRNWARLVTGTLVGVVFLTADLVGIGAAPGFGWKQVLGTLAALALVVPAAWRIFRDTERSDAR